MLKTIIVEVLAISLFLFPAIAQSPTIPLLQEGRLLLIEGNSLVSGQSGALQNDLERLIWEAADKYQIDYDLLYNLAICESGLKHEKYGDNGRAYGLFQWWQSSWDMYNKKFGTTLDRKNIDDQAEMTAKVLNIGGYKNWTNCFKKQVLADLK